MSKPLKFWSLTISNNHHTLLSPEEMDNVFVEFSKQWCYQGEYGDQLHKPHYQCRLILEDPQMKATMIHCLSMRGIPANDVTFLPESNKSIEQGGLAFYVMDSTKDVWLPPRCDPSYKPPRPPNWIPKMCQHLPDRPWQSQMITLLNSPPDHRKIIWIATIGKGGVAKSLFTTYCHVTGLAKFVGDGTPLNLKLGVIAMGEHKGYAFDLPKTFAADNKIGDYINAIETIKNGFILVTMHGKTQELIMEERPHVVVYCNRMPPYQTMTDGRFDAYTINPDRPISEQYLEPVRPDPPTIEIDDEFNVDYT